MTFRTLRAGSRPYFELDALIRSKGYMLLGTRGAARNGGHCDFVYTPTDRYEQIMDELAELSNQRKRERWGPKEK